MIGMRWALGARAARADDSAGLACGALCYADLTLEGTVVTAPSSSTVTRCGADGTAVQ